MCIGMASSKTVQSGGMECRTNLRHTMSLTAASLKLEREATQFAEEKRKKMLQEEPDEASWRQTIKRQMEEEIEKRVREALETPPPERRKNQLAQAQQLKHQRRLEELEQLNSHVNAQLTDKEQDSMRRRRWKVLQAKRRMQSMLDDEFGLDQDCDISPEYKMDLLLAERFPTGSLNSDPFSLGLGFDPNTPMSTLNKIKSQEYYARVSSKALSNFGGLTDAEKHEFYYAFTKRAFRDALRTGKLPDGSLIELLSSGRYRDRHGILRDEHGPFWPSDYGPLHPVPVHEKPLHQKHELFYVHNEETKNKQSFENQSTPYFGRWRGCQIVFDTERSNKDYDPPHVSEGIAPSLTFESRFECGNLRQARRVGQFEYELVLKTDLYTRRHTQWYYFRIRNALPGITYKFRIINLLKKDSLYNHGMRPLMYSEKSASKGVGWLRTGHHIHYTRNACNLQCPLLSRDMSYFMLEWQMEFSHADDSIYLAHCYPFTYSDLKDDLDSIIADPERSKIMKREVMCETRAGNSCFLLTVTNFDVDNRLKKAVVATARVHPGETNSSWMMRGLLEFITGPSEKAKILRDKCIFKIVPMLNPDGVIVGNYRCSLAARDLNRNYRHPRKESFPTVWHTKQMMMEIGKTNDIVVYCDLHGHSRKQNVFMYGCNMSDPKSVNASMTETYLRERLFPWLMSQKAPDKFWFHGCKFQVRRCKESTGRVVMFRQLQIANSFTMEATFCGTTICKGDRRHFNIQDFQEMGSVFCEAVVDYIDTKENATKEHEAIVNVARVITHQILESRHLLPPDLPDFTTELGQQKMTEYAEKQKSLENGKPIDKVTQAFLNILEKSSSKQKMAAAPNIEKHNNKQEPASQDVDNLLNSMVSPSVTGCIQLLEELNLQQSLVESDSSDSDSESEPEMKYVESKPRRKKKRRRNKNQSRKKESHKTKDDLERPHSDTGLPAIKSNDSGSAKKKEQELTTLAPSERSWWASSPTTSVRGFVRSAAPLPPWTRVVGDDAHQRLLEGVKVTPSLTKYVKALPRTTPGFVNKYQGRSNGGIPCFSEERLLQRASKRMHEMKKKMDDEQYRRGSLPSELADPSASGYSGSLTPSSLSRMHESHSELRHQFQQAFQQGMPIHIRTGCFTSDRHDGIHGNIQLSSGKESCDSDDFDDVPDHLPRRAGLSTLSSPFQGLLAKSGTSTLCAAPRKMTRGPTMRPPTTPGALPRTTHSGMLITSPSSVAGVSDFWTNFPLKNNSGRHLTKAHQVQPLDGTLDFPINLEGRHSSRNPPGLLSREYTDLLIQKLRNQKAAASQSAQPLLTPRHQSGERHCTCE